MTKFIYDGLYYPVVGSSIMFENNTNKTIISKKLGGYGNNYIEWFPHYGIKCKLFNPDKPYKQLVIDAINNNPAMEIYKFYYNDKGFCNKENSNGFMYYVRLTREPDKTIGNIADAYHISNLTDLQTHRPDSHQICAGYNKETDTFYGWSRCAKVGFKLGDYIFEEDYEQEIEYWLDDEIPYTKHGHKVIQTYEDMKQAAINFANSVA